VNLLDLARTALNEREADYPSVATPVEAEVRRLFTIVSEDWPGDEKVDGLAWALEDQEAALRSFRLLIPEREIARPPAPADDGMRTCRECLNLALSGRCRAAERGESFGKGIATSVRYEPGMPDRPQRCGAYVPGPSDPDRRSGRERWPWLY